MQQDRLDVLFLISIEVDVLIELILSISSKTAIKEKNEKTLSNKNKIEVYKNKHYFPSYY